MEETLRVQREETQYAQRKTTQSQNFAAYQLETQAAVGIAGAEALGQMGSNGAMGLGGASGGSDGMNPAAMMAGMAMGGAIGQNMAGMMGGMMNGVTQKSPGETPPPIPISTYCVAENGHPTGPLDLSYLEQMVKVGTFTKDSLVWKKGMADWQKAGSVQELDQVFASTPPVIPSDSTPPIPQGD